MQVQEILKLKVGDVQGRDTIVVYLGTHKVKRSYRFDEDLKNVREEYTPGKIRMTPLCSGA